MELSDLYNSFDLSNAKKRTIITEISKPGNEAYILSFKSKFSLEDLEYVKEALSLLIDGNLLLRIKKDEDMNFSQYYSDAGGSFSISSNTFKYDFSDILVKYEFI